MNIFTTNLSPKQYNLWDEIVDLSPSGTIFHKSKWLVTVGRESRVKTEFYGAFSNDKFVGGCAVHSKKIGGIFNYVTTTLPLTPYSGVLIYPHDSSKIRKREEQEREVIYALLSEIQKRNPSFVSITMSPQVIDIRPYIWRRWNEHIHFCYIFPLENDIIKHVSQNVRWSINKAKKTGILITKKWDYDLYWDLTINTYSKQKIKPPFSQKLLFSLFDVIREENWGEMWIAKTEAGEGVAGEIMLWDSNMAYRWSAASNEHFKKTGATSLLLSEMMIDLKRKGFKNFNMMAANTPHLTNFISSFNPNLVPYYSVSKSHGVFRFINCIQSIMK